MFTAIEARDRIQQLGKSVLSTGMGRSFLGLIVAGGAAETLTNISWASSDDLCVAVGLTPDTILNDGKDATVLEVLVKEACRPDLLRVETHLSHPFTIDGQNRTSPDAISIQLKDDGTGRDKQAGDWTFTSGEIRVQAPFTDPYQGINGLFNVNAFGSFKLIYGDGSMRRREAPRILVLSPEVAILSPKTQSDSIQTTPHVINMRDDFLAAAQQLRLVSGEQDLRGLTHKLYNMNPDSDPYHFLIMTSNKRIFVASSSDSRNGRDGGYISLRRDFNGTGGGSYYETDLARLFGSQGNLKHIILTTEPIVPGLLFHETGHLTAADLDTLGLSSGRHWKDNHSAGGIVQGTRWVDNGDGTFTSLGWGSPTASKLEQYLWGWIRPEQLPPIYVALNENQSFGIAGTRINGPFKVVTIQDIIAQHGVRTPGPDTALRHFKVGYVYTTSGRLATATEMTARELLAQRLPILWSQATEGQSTLEFVLPESGPAIIEPFAGKTLDGLGATLRFTPNPDIKQFHVQVIPYNNDGPGINLIIGAQELVQSGKFIVSPPEFGKGNYVMLPGTSYTWRVRTTSSTNPNIKEDDPSWSAWVKDTFRTPAPSSATIEPVTPNGTKLDSLNPTFQWKDNNTQMFYYEVQVSKDPNFNTDPQTATAAVYWVLRHGGVTNPPNSFTIPPNFPLEPGTKYYWRARQRVQGDGTPINWSQAWSVDVSATARVQTAIVLHQKDNGEIDWDKMQTDHWRAIKEEFVPAA